MNEGPPVKLDDKLSIIKRATDLASFVTDCHNLRHDGAESGVYDLGITLDNVFVADSGTHRLGQAPFKIPDFNIAKMKKGRQSIIQLVPRERRHTTMFTAPEVQCGHADVAPACDTWSFGCLLLILLGWTFGGPAWYEEFRNTCFWNGRFSLLEKDDSARPDPRRRHSVDFHEYRLNSRLPTILDKLRYSIDDPTARMLFSALSEIITTQALIPSPQLRCAMTDIHGAMLQAYYSALNSEWALQSGPGTHDPPCTPPGTDAPRHGGEDNVQEGFMKTLYELQAGLQEMIVSPTADKSDQFYPHLTAQEFFQHKPSKVKRLLRLTCQFNDNMDIDDETIFFKRIVGEDDADSASKILATFCKYTDVHYPSY